jgi:hypothetical protein
LRIQEQETEGAKVLGNVGIDGYEGASDLEDDILG